MEKLSLKYIVRKPKEQTKNTSLLILLHGYGSNEEDLYSFASELPSDLIIVSARALQDLGFGSYAWYTIHFNNTQKKFSDILEAIKARDVIYKFIKEVQEKYTISPEKTFLLGFSQGTILGMATALNHPTKIKNIIGLSGYVNHDILPDNLEILDYSNLSFYCSHGTVDQVIPIDWARQTPVFLKSLNIEHTYSEFPIGHGVAPKNFYELRNWISTKI